MSMYPPYEVSGDYDGSRERIFTGLQLTQGAKSRRWVLSMSYGLFVLILVLGVLSASWWIRPNAGERETPDWRLLLAKAEISREQGDSNQADALYSRAGRLASWRRDWVGLYATACSMSKSYEGNSLGVIRGLLVGAMLAAQDQQSKEGLHTAAKALASMGQDNLANMALSRIRKEWPDIESSDVEKIPISCQWLNRHHPGY